MIPTLPAVVHEHHERLMRHVDQLPALGDLIGSAPVAVVRTHVDDALTFLAGTLIPHMEAAERTLYPELERMLQNRHSMAPMRREHKEVRQLVDQLVHVRQDLSGERLTTGETIALRRVIFRLYALLKVHLAEEELYVGIVEHGVSPAAADTLAAAMAHAIATEV